MNLKDFRPHSQYANYFTFYFTDNKLSISFFFSFDATDWDGDFYKLCDDKPELISRTTSKFVKLHSHDHIITPDHAEAINEFFNLWQSDSIYS